MTATDKLNSAARSMGWANWAEVISHNAPPHVINAVVMRAMEEEPVGRDYKKVLDDLFNNATDEQIMGIAEYVRSFVSTKPDTRFSDLANKILETYTTDELREFADKIRDGEPALTWRPGARVRVKPCVHGFIEGEEYIVKTESMWPRMWVCTNSKNWCVIRESDAVVVG